MTFKKTENGSGEWERFLMEMDLTDWESVKGLIRESLIDPVRAGEAWETIPRRELPDSGLGVIYVLVPVDRNPLGFVHVGRNLMEWWGIDEEVLARTAEENMRRDGLLCSRLEDLLGEMMCRELPEGGPGIYVLSNRDRFLGAVWAVRPGILKTFSLAHAYEKVYVIPSSIHEVLLVPEGEGISARELTELLREVNRTVVSEGDCLSDDLFSYHVDCDRLIREK